MVQIFQSLSKNMELNWVIFSHRELAVKNASKPYSSYSATPFVLEKTTNSSCWPRPAPLPLRSSPVDSYGSMPCSSSASPPPSASSKRPGSAVRRTQTLGASGSYFPINIGMTLGRWSTNSVCLGFANATASQPNRDESSEVLL